MYVWILCAIVTVYGRPQTILEYKPQRPFYQPQPSGSHLGVIVPSGQPWPDSSQGYQNFSQFGGIFDRIKETETTTKASGFTWPDVDKPLSPEPPKTSILSEDNPQSSTSSTAPHIDYNQTTPLYQPNPGSVLGQIIPSEESRNNTEGYQNFSSSVINRIKETTTQSSPVVIITSRDEEHTTHAGQIVPVKPSTSQPVVTHGVSTNTPITLEYQPIRPSFHPHPGNTIGQIIPPGKPWPDSVDGYQNFSQLGYSANLANKIKETTQPMLTFGNTQNLESIKKNSTLQPDYKQNTSSFHTNPSTNVDQITLLSRALPNASETTSQTSTTKNINLDNYSNSANTIIIPTETRWPQSPEDYQNVSKTSLVNLDNRVQDSNNVTPVVPELPITPEPSENYYQTTADLIGLLQELLNKQKTEPNNVPTTSAVTPIGFIWKTETSSEEKHQHESEEFDVFTKESA